MIKKYFFKSGTIRLVAISFVMASICLALLTPAYADEVGHIQFTRGAVTMQNHDGSSARLVAKDEQVQRGEVIKTGPRSFTIVKLKDGTRMTIRPNSSFTVEQMNAKQDSSASAVLRLFRGGLRAITGYISKKNPNGYKLRTSVATIGIRGTEFDTRLCQNDCEDENTKLNEKRDKQLEKTVARVVFVRGSLTAGAIEGGNRTLKAGSSVFEGDTLVTRENSYSIIVFRDKSRISLQSGTVFRVDEMKFNDKDESKSSALFSLLSGGLRTVTGLLGKLHPSKYKMRTSIATIGIRGTGYDLMCTGACQSGEASGLSNSATDPVALPAGDGLYAHVWDGAIEFGGQVLPKGSSGYKLSKSAKPVVLPTVPDFFKTNPVPKPDSVDVEEKSLFSKTKAEEAPPGLYVSVTEGNVTVENKTGSKLELGPGQAGYADVLGRKVSRLPKTPAFQQFDAYPMPDVQNPGVVNVKAGAIGSDDDSGRVCEVK